MARPSSPRRHGSLHGRGPIVVVLGLGLALRVLTMLASGPVSLYLNDSKDYLNASQHLTPGGYHPLGYAVFLRLLDAAHHPLPLAIVQHLLGLAVGAAVIVIAQRLRLPSWGAALAAAPQLLDPYVAVAEQFVIAETLFAALVLGAVWATATRRPLLAGLLAALATLTRTVGLPLAIVLLLALVVQRLGWRRLLVATSAAALPVAGYALWFAAVHGSPGLTQNSGIYLYGRLAPFADCGSAALTPAQRPLCDPRPVADRPNPDFYLWSPDAPLKHVTPPGPTRNALATATSHAMLRDNLGAWAGSTLGYLLHYGAPERRAGSKDSTLTTWIVDTRTNTAPAFHDPRLADGYRTTAHVQVGPTRVLRTLQHWIYTPVWLLALLAAAGLLGVRQAGGVRRQWAVAALGALTLLVVPSATAGWDIRFLLPVLPLLGLAAATGVVLARGGA